jgi:hypothetical protein
MSNQNKYKRDLSPFYLERNFCMGLRLELKILLQTTDKKAKSTVKQVIPVEPNRVLFAGLKAQTQRNAKKSQFFGESFFFA